MKVLERKIKRNVNKQFDFIKDNIDYFTNEQLPIINQVFINIKEIKKSIEILYVQGIIDRQCRTLLIYYLDEMRKKLYIYEQKVKGLK